MLGMSWNFTSANTGNPISTSFARHRVRGGDEFETDLQAADMIPDRGELQSALRSGVSSATKTGFELIESGSYSDVSVRARESRPFRRQHERFGLQRVQSRSPRRAIIIKRNKYKDILDVCRKMRG